ncbi:hypothetical protein [Microbacterium dauci]|uniref:Alpha/beta hydrolase n=1 Tax=Microbacterium dauci TaxID=3048008 RepID=A0ABT6ZDA7_9MICO|nr:hypothetical protein [Microbacterium sp. LX3-4]MDJ1114146.1 hypothetical protein [Microbacterium sp. LX3-4]
MADGDWDIRSGRIIAVDPETLRHAAGLLDVLETDAARLHASLAEAQSTLYASTSGWRVHPLVDRTAALTQRAASLAGTLRILATAYELVELEAARTAALVVGDRDAARILAERASQLAAAAPVPAALADELRSTAPSPHADILGQLALTSAVAGGGVLVAGAGLLGLVRDLDRGRVHAHARTVGTAAAPRVSLVEQGTAAAPTSLRDVAARIPGTSGGGIRVERYSMPQGGQRFALYLTGTRAIGGTEVFDMGSNLDLYGGRDASSLAAARIALERSGAKPGDTVLLAGHSQGAMAVSHLALDSEYDVTAMIGFGNPIQADLGQGTLQVDVRHTDDPVSALALGGHDATIGAPGSFVAERSADPLPSLGDLTAQVHHLDAYVESAEQLDASSDPRLDGVRERLAGFDGAASVDVFVYDAVSASSADEG